MAKKPVTAPQYDPEAEYLVELARPITVGRTKIRPMATAIRLKGKVVAANADSVLSAVKAE